MHFGCIAADLSSGDFAIFDAKSSPRVRVVDALLASAALPAVFDPVSIDGRLYMDAGVSNNAPLSLLEGRGRKVLALVTDTQELDAGSPFSLLWCRCNFYPRAEISKADPARTTVLKMPPPPGHVHLFRVNEADLQEMRRQGRATAAASAKHQVAGLVVFFAVLALSF